MHVPAHAQPMCAGINAQEHKMLHQLGMFVPIAFLKPALLGGLAQPTSRRARFCRWPPPDGRHPRGELGRPSPP
eukprot:14988839-Alexandrium_andersonii.AAC.1